MKTKKYPIEKYKYTIDEANKTVSAQSTYAGNAVKAVAKCDPRDEFDIGAGKRLAAARCNAKVAYKRKQRAHNNCMKALAMVAEANAYLKKQMAYLDDASTELAKANEEVARLVVKM